MTTDPTQLLRQLGPVVLPPYAAGAAPAAPQAPVEQRSFDELLAQARGGGLDSGRHVQSALAPGEALTPEQLRRLGAAADRAEAAGAQRALMLLDGRGLVMDVASRTLSAELTGERPEVINVDAALYVNGDS